MFFSWLQNAQTSTKLKKSNKKQKLQNANVFVLAEPDFVNKNSIIEDFAAESQKNELHDSKNEMLHFQSDQGPVWILKVTPSSNTGHMGLLAESEFAKARDFAGVLIAQLKSQKFSELKIQFQSTNEMTELGFLTGLDSAIYNFKESLKSPPELIKKTLVIEKKGPSHFDLNIIKKAQKRAASISLARHLVNLPPNLKTPTQFISFAKKLKWSSSSRFTDWNMQKLNKENCNLLVAVGKGSDDPPHLLKISYRPKKKSSRRPVAIVGKGITFDTGGLDIKPSSAMRMMKKDMGGAASTLAIAYWVDQSHYEHPVDFYLALAENAVDGKSMRPGDVYTARNGMTVEIDNTDAEGRLVLADALDVAISDSSRPEVVINLATLTGACRVALGIEFAGLFSNDDDLAEELTRSGQIAGDPNWRLPLVERYFSSYSSPFADFKNSGESFGGAITAGLFLQKFVKNTKWAHIDMYSWTDRANGIFHSAGGNAQSVQALIHWLEGRG